MVFISGHLDLTEEEFCAHYKLKIDETIQQNKWFIVGDAPGADAMAQKYLYEQNIMNVIVFHMLENPRIFLGRFFVFGGFNSDSERDCAMTLYSNEDIAWIRPGREKSGTAKNLDRRKRLKVGRYCFDKVEGKI